MNTPEPPVTGKRHSVGVLYVHGIGQQKRGESLAEFADALHGWIRQRIRGISEGHRNRHTSRETLDAKAPTAMQGAKLHSGRGAQRQYLAYLNAAHSFVPSGALAAEGLFELPHPDHEPLLASAELAEVPASGEAAPLSVTLELDWTDAQGRQHASDWLLAESWWAGEVREPSIWQLLVWAPRTLPMVLAVHLFSRRPVGRVREAAYSAAAVMGAVFALPVIYLLVAAAGAGSFMPWPRIAAMAKDVRTLLTRFIGDAYMFAGSSAQRAVILGGIERDLQWLAARCDSVVVVGHSQGAMLAYLACRHRPSNVRRLLTLGSGIGKIHALASALDDLDPIARARTALLLTANVAGVGIWLAAALALSGQIPALTAAYLALYAALAAGGFGLLAFSNFVSDALSISLEEQFWDRRMQLGDISLDSVDPLALAVLRQTGCIDGGMWWLDVLATHDPVAGKAPNWGTVPEHEVSAQPAEGPWPRSISVTNARSLLFDHTGYLKNGEECVARIAQHCADLAGTEGPRWVAPDCENPVLAQARSDLFVRHARITAGLIVMSIGYLVFCCVSTQALNGAVSWAEIWRAPVWRWLNLGIAGALASAWVAANSARRHALSRLAIGVSERRNWCAQRDAKGCLDLVQTGCKGWGRVSLGEGAGLAFAASLPAIVLAALLSFGETYAVAWSLVSIPVAHAAVAFLRLRDNRAWLEQCYGAARSRPSAKQPL